MLPMEKTNRNKLGQVPGPYRKIEKTCPILFLLKLYVSLDNLSVIQLITVKRVSDKRNLGIYIFRTHKKFQSTNCTSIKVHKEM